MGCFTKRGWKNHAANHPINSSVIATRYSLSLGAAETKSLGRSKLIQKIVRVRDRLVPSEAQIQRFQHRFTEMDALLATASSDGTARLWRVADGTQVRVINGSGSGAKFSADGKLLLTVDAGAIKVWRVADGALLHNYSDAGAGTLAIAANGKYFAYGSGGAVVLVRMPVVVEETRQDGQIILRWTGGSGLYRIQRRNDLLRGVWHNFGPPTTATSFTNEITREPIFYRVVSLPNAP
jgi:hypothetical protein